MNKFFSFLMVFVLSLPAMQVGCNRGGIRVGTHLSARRFRTLAHPTLIHIFQSNFLPDEPHQDFKDGVVRYYELSKHARLAKAGGFAQLGFDEEARRLKTYAARANMSIPHYLELLAKEEYEEGMALHGHTFQYAVEILRDKLFLEADVQRNLSLVALGRARKATYKHIRLAREHIAGHDEQLDALLDELDYEIL